VKTADIPFLKQLLEVVDLVCGPLELPLEGGRLTLLVLQPELGVRQLLTFLRHLEVKCLFSFSTKISSCHGGHSHFFLWQIS